MSRTVSNSGNTPLIVLDVDAGDPAQSWLLSKFMPNFVFALAMFPNINFFPFLGSNNQPVAALVIMVSWFLSGRYRFKVNRFTIFLAAVIAVSTAYALIGFVYSSLSLSGIGNEPGFYTYRVETFSMAMTLISYLVGPLIFVYLLFNITRVSVKLVLGFIFLQLVFACLQYFGSAEIQGQMEQVFGNVFIGFNAAKYEFGRGVAGTFPEPSHLGRYLVVVLGMLLCFWHERRGSRSWTIAGLIGIALLFALNQSITAVMVLAMWLFFQMILSILNLRFGHLALAIAACGLLILALYFAPEASRLSTIVGKIEAAGEVIADDNLIGLQVYGGIRLVNMIIGYASAFIFPLGQGLGSYLTTLPPTADLLSIDIWSTNYYVQHVSVVGLENVITKPNGYGAQLAFDFGYIGLALMLFLAISVIATVLKNRGFQLKFWGLPLVGLTLIAFYTTTTFPAPWILLAMIAFFPHQRPRYWIVSSTDGAGEALVRVDLEGDKAP